MENNYLSAPKCMGRRPFALKIHRSTQFSTLSSKTPPRTPQNVVFGRFAGGSAPGPPIPLPPGRSQPQTNVPKRQDHPMGRQGEIRAKIQKMPWAEANAAPAGRRCSVGVGWLRDAGWRHHRPRAAVPWQLGGKQKLCNIK